MSPTSRTKTQLIRFRDEMAEQQGPTRSTCCSTTPASAAAAACSPTRREEWEKTFNVCWGGVYYGCRAFLPMLMKADEAHIVNTSSVNGFWASLGPDIPHTAYSAAKFAVKGFTEALMTDLKLNAPHVKCSVVMPGHIGTSIVTNSRARCIRAEQGAISQMEIQSLRIRLTKNGIDAAKMTDEQVTALAHEVAKAFLEKAPTTAAQAAKIILDGVKADKWRILVGEDAHWLDKKVRETPEEAYTPEFHKAFVEASGWRLG